MPVNFFYYSVWKFFIHIKIILYIFYLFPEVCLTLISFTSLSYSGPAHSLSLLSRTLVLCINNKDTTIKIFTNFHLELENGNHKMGISDDVIFKKGKVPFSTV